MKTGSKGEIVIFKPKGWPSGLRVHLDKETVWITQEQMVKLFQKTKQNVSLHIRNIFREGELDEKSVVKESLTTARDGKNYRIKYYNLDVIISIGYRVKSKRGTQFRIWATKVLRDYIVQGYSINEKRLKEQNTRLRELQKTVNLMGRLLERKELDQSETAGLLRVITDYSYALTVLDQYDRGKLKIQKTTRRKKFILTDSKAYQAITRLGEELKNQGEKLGMFGAEKDKSFKGSLGAIYQTFDGKELYPSVEEKAAHLLYFVTKNHSFVDGNKRIAAFLFIWYLDANGVLYSEGRRKRVGDNALVALTLLIAESAPEYKDTITKVIVNLINKENQ
jgi:prophage maintenance system killer protein